MTMTTSIEYIKKPNVQKPFPEDDVDPQSNSVDVSAEETVPDTGEEEELVAEESEEVPPPQVYA